MEHVGADNMEPVRSYIADWLTQRFAEKRHEAFARSAMLTPTLGARQSTRPCIGNSVANTEKDLSVCVWRNDRLRHGR